VSKSTKANMIVRVEMLKCGMPQWQLAEIMGVPESTMNRILRNELNPEIQNRIAALVRGEHENVEEILSNIRAERSEKRQRKKRKQREEYYADMIMREVSWYEKQNADRWGRDFEPERNDALDKIGGCRR